MSQMYKSIEKTKKRYNFSISYLNYGFFNIFFLKSESLKVLEKSKLFIEEGWKETNW